MSERLKHNNNYTSLSIHEFIQHIEEGLKWRRHPDGQKVLHRVLAILELLHYELDDRGEYKRDMSEKLYLKLLTLHCDLFGSVCGNKKKCDFCPLSKLHCFLNRYASACEKYDGYYITGWPERSASCAVRLRAYVNDITSNASGGVVMRSYDDIVERVKHS